MGSKKTKNTQTYTPPKNVEAGANKAIEIGTRIANQEYSPYSGERVAPLSANEQQGIDMASRTAGASQPYYAASAGYAERGAQQFTDANMADYMNPYIKGALDPAAREIGEAGAREEQRIAGSAASMNAFSGSRSQIAQGQNREATLQAKSDLYGKGYAQAYESAVSIWGGERARDMEASGRFQDIGTSVSNANKTDISTLMTTGATDRGVEQSMRDFDYKQFLEGRDWDFRAMGAIISALEGTKGSYSTTQTSTTTESGGELAQAIGIGATLMGAFFNPAGAVSSALTQYSAPDADGLQTITALPAKR